MKRTVLRSPAVVELLNPMVRVELYTDGTGRNVETNQRLQEEQFGTVALPLYVLLDPDGREVARINRKASEEEFLAFLQKIE